MKSLVRVYGLAVPLVAALAAIGCKDSTDSSSARVQAELVRLPGGSTLGAISPTATSIAKVPGTIPWTNRVTLSSVRAPITMIRLVSTSGSQALVYTCPGATAEECLVELNGPALQDVLGTDPKAVPVGTYNQVDVIYCSGATGRAAHATGTAIIGGTTYYTRTVGNLGTAGPAEPVTIDYAGCASRFAISPPLVIEDSTTATTVLRLYFDILDIASAALASLQTSSRLVASGCTAVSPPGSAPFLCLADHEVVAAVGTTPPRIEHYRVNDGATLGLAFDASSDAFLGGYFRRYYAEDQLWNPGFAPDGNIASLTSNGDGSYVLDQGPDARGQPRALFPAWRRAAHGGTFILGGRATSYSAVRLP